MNNAPIKDKDISWSELATYSLNELYSLLSQPEYKKIATKIWLVILMINPDKFLEELQKLDIGLYEECEDYQRIRDNEKYEEEKLQQEYDDYVKAEQEQPSTTKAKISIDITIN